MAFVEVLIAEKKNKMILKWEYSVVWTIPLYTCNFYLNLIGLLSFQSISENKGKEYSQSLFFDN